MPKTGQTRTVKAMHEEIAKAGKKRSKPVDKPVDQGSHIGHATVSNAEASHRQPIGHATVSSMDTQECHRTHQEQYICKPYVLGNFERVELKKAGLSDEQIDDSLAHLLEAYHAEGLTPDPDRLPAEILQLARVGL